MVVAIAGGHGKIGLLLTKLLAERGDRVLSIVRNPDQADHVATAGGEAVVVDLESSGAEELGSAIADADAVVFAAGAGPGSGAERKETMDYGGAVLLIEAAKLAGRRSLRDDLGDVGRRRPRGRRGLRRLHPREGPRRRRARRLRPRLHDRPARRPHRRRAEGQGPDRDRLERGEIPRADVAAVVAACLADPKTIGRTFEVVSGEDQIELALTRFARRLV